MAHFENIDNFVIWCKTGPANSRVDEFELIEEICNKEFEIFKELLAESNRVKNKTLFLPIHPNYDLEFINKVIKKVNNFQYEV